MSELARIMQDATRTAGSAVLELADTLRLTFAYRQQPHLFRVRFHAPGMPKFSSGMARVLGDQTIMLSTRHGMVQGTRVNVLLQTSAVRDNSVIHVVGRVVHIDPPGLNQNNRYLIRVASAMAAQSAPMPLAAAV